MRSAPGFALAILTLLAGCSTAGRTVRPTPLPPAPASGPGETAAPEATMPPAPATAVAGSFPAEEPPPIPEPPPAAPPAEPGTNWLRLDRLPWAGRLGAFEFDADARRMRFGGTAVALGYGTVRREGGLWMHPIDVAKNLEPLLAPPAPPPNRVVVLDPGHGGVNAGTRAITGNRFEKEFTLDWARRLRPLLEARGWTVHLTRTNDVDVPLAARVAEADARGAAVFVSLHFNSAFPDPRAAGVETYCLTPQGLPSSITRNFPDDVASFHPNNAHDAGNLRLAVRVQRAMSAATGAADRGVRRARFMEVLRRQDRPAILAEGGFLSNPDEARRIAQPEYRQRLALAVAAALGDSPP